MPCSPESVLSGRARLDAQLRSELAQPVPPAIGALAQDVARHIGPRVHAILFYGSCLRDGTLDGLVDLYIIVDGYPVAPMSALGSVAAAIMPPTIYRHRMDWQGQALTAKVAVISWAQLQARVRCETLDTTIWARLCQPVALVYRRDSSATDLAAAAVADASIAAALWAARLGPDTGTSAEFWENLFRHTYAAELRVEGPERAEQIHGAAPGRYRDLLVVAWQAAGLLPAGAELGAIVTNPCRADARRRFRASWRLRSLAGRSLNVSRLLKAGFTFDAGADYIAWKVQRHVGKPIRLSAFQRRHPVLAAPSILWTVIRARLAR